jgi:hypothetical protein
VLNEDGVSKEGAASLRTRDTPIEILRGFDSRRLHLRLNEKAVFRSGVFAGIATIETVVRAVRRDSFELLLEIRRDAWISRGLNGAWHRY